jgi:signal transduction histidine kinase
MPDQAGNRELKELREAFGTLQVQRRALAKHIHDHIGQLLTAMLFNIRALDDHALPAEAEPAMAQMKELAVQVKDQARGLASMLRQSALDDWGLPGVLQRTIDDWATRTSGVVDVHCGPPPAPGIPLPLELALFIALKDGLAFSMSRPGVRTIGILLSHRSGQIWGGVEDDGDNNEAPPVLAEAEKIVSSAGGTLSLEQGPARGLTLTFRIPFL